MKTLFFQKSSAQHTFHSKIHTMNNIDDNMVLQALLKTLLTFWVLQKG